MELLQGCKDDIRGLRKLRNVGDEMDRRAVLEATKAHLAAIGRHIDCVVASARGSARGGEALRLPLWEQVVDGERTAALYGLFKWEKGERACCLCCKVDVASVDLAEQQPNFGSQAATSTAHVATLMCGRLRPSPFQHPTLTTNIRGLLRLRSHVVANLADRLLICRAPC